MAQPLPRYIDDSGSRYLWDLCEPPDVSFTGRVLLIWTADCSRGSVHPPARIALRLRCMLMDMAAVLAWSISCAPPERDACACQPYSPAWKYKHDSRRARFLGRTFTRRETPVTLRPGTWNMIFNSIKNAYFQFMRQTLLETLLRFYPVFGWHPLTDCHL